MSDCPDLAVISPPRGHDPRRPAPIARGSFINGEDECRTSTWLWDVDLPRIAAYSWGEFATLISARNEKLVGSILARPARIPPDIDNRIRLAWLRAYGLVERIRRDPCSLRMRPRGAERQAVRFLLIGDPGEGDLSQWALRRPLLSRAEGLDFALILSDVIYPAGEALHYRDRFHGPLRELPVPVYATPGNHDWNDGALASFMTQFTGWEPKGARVLPPTVEAELAAMRLGIWRDASKGRGDDFRRLVALRKLRAARLETDWPREQPASFFAVDAAGLLLIALDNGFDPKQALDEVQSRWLLDLVAAHPGVPKILLAGKPFAKRGGLDDDMPLHPEVARATGVATLQALVGDEGRGFVAVIGGDTHNYQRYSPDGRAPDDGAAPVPPGHPGNPHLIVAGGSGAYMAGTIGTAAGLLDRLKGGEEPVLYPTEEQSRWYLGQQVAQRLGLVPVALGLAAVLALVMLAASSVIASVGNPGAETAALLAAVCATGATLAVLIRAVLIAAGRRGLASTLLLAGWMGLGLIAIGAFWAALLALIVEDDVERLATVLAFPTAAVLVGAAFLPFGVLAQAFPVPSNRAATAITGAVALTWLLALGYPAMAGYGPGSGLIQGSTALEVAVLLVPVAIVWAGYWNRTVRRPTPAQWIGVGAVALALGALAAHLWWGWGPHLTAAVIAACAAAVVAAVVAAPLGRRAYGPAAAAALAWGLAGMLLPPSAGHDVHVAQVGRALLPAALLALTVGAAAFVVVRQVGPTLARQPWLVEWLGRPGRDPWSLFESTTPPFFKSFLEVDVRRGEDVTITCWGVSGFEADAERPILVDRVSIPWPGVGGIDGTERR